MYHRSFFTNYFHVPEIANIHQFNPNRIRNGKYTFYEIVSRMLFTRIHQLIWQTQHTRQLTFDVCTAECCEVAYMHRRLVNKSFKHLRITEVISLFKVNRQVSITIYRKGERRKVQACRSQMIADAHVLGVPETRWSYWSLLKFSFLSWIVYIFVFDWKYFLELCTLIFICLFNIFVIFKMLQSTV